MRQVTMRTAGILVLLVAALGAAAAFSWQGLRVDEPRTLVLVARGMAFELEDWPGRLNPSLPLVAGERVRLVVRNQDPGMKHDLTIGALSLRTGTLSYGESDALVFTVPARAGTLDYACSLHAVMMRGALLVRSP